MAVRLEPAVTLPWLVRLRWVFLAVQLIVLPIVHWGFESTLEPLPVVVELAAMTASNLYLTFRRGPAMTWRIGAVMLLDVALLTLLLRGSGGSANPFTVLYLVEIALSAITLAVGWTVAIAAASLAGFASLFIGADEHAMHHMMMQTHLRGMWAAFATAAVLIAFFVGRVARAIASQREQIAQLREATQRAERLASVTRLAANAAHELGSPLATIAVAAHEAKRHGGAALADLELIALEVERCNAILRRMSARGSTEAAEQVSTTELADQLRDELGEEVAHRLDVTVTEAMITTPRDQLVQSVVALAHNALEASVERVSVELRVDQSALEIVVADRGTGIPDDVLARIGTPFYTTKGEGKGLGLGVFLARAFCESRGGRLTIQSARGTGTRAAISLPLEAA